MSKTLTFMGHSDDIFSIEGGRQTEPDEIGCFDKGVAVKLIDAAAGGGLIVTGQYAPDSVEVACWTIGLMPLDEDVAWPDWPMRWKAAPNGYSPLLEIDVPESVTITPAASE